MKPLSGLIALVVGVALIALSGEGVDLSGDPVSKAFDRYELEWRAAALRGAEELEKETIKTEQEIQEFLANAQPVIRRGVFKEIATREAELLNPWTAEKHIEILRGYQ